MSGTPRADRRVPPPDPRYRVDARSLPFTPSWFWEIIDTIQGSIVENSLALSRTVYLSPADALAAGHDYLDVIDRPRAA